MKAILELTPAKLFKILEDIFLQDEIKLKELKLKFLEKDVIITKDENLDYIIFEIKKDKVLPKC